MIEGFREERTEFEGVEVSCLVGGEGFPILMIHGSGPGASTLGNWRSVLGPLAANFRIYAMDLVGFGQSARKPAPPYFDFDLWLRQCLWILDRIDAPAIGVIGHSISGALALKLAARHPRVAAVLTTGTMGLPFPVNPGTARTWTYPADRAALIATAQTLIHDHSRIDDAYLRNRDSVLRAEGYEEYFGSMFGGDKQRFVDASVLTPEELASIRCPVSMLHGRDDTAFPPSVSIEIAQKLPWADLLLIGNCSHSIAMEHPAKLIATASTLFPADLPQENPAHV